MKGEGGSGAEIVCGALGRLCPCQSKGHLISLKMRGVTEGTPQMGMGWGEVEGSLVEVMDEEQGMWKGS